MVDTDGCTNKHMEETLDFAIVQGYCELMILNIRTDVQCRCADRSGQTV